MKNHTHSDNFLKKQQLRSVIVPVAAELFRLHGIRAVKMDDIAANLKMSKRTLYETYTNKTELLLDVMRYLVENSHEQMRAKAEECDDVIDILIEIIRRQLEIYATTNSLFFEDLKRYPEVKDAIQDFHKDDDMRALEFFNRGIREGYFRKDVNYELINIIGRGVGQMLNSNSEYNRFPMEVVFKSFVCTIIRGICSEKGIVKLDEFLNA